jgi:hypothetical protein
MVARLVSTFVLSVFAFPAFAQERPMPAARTYYDGVASALLARGYTDAEVTDPALREMIARDPGGREVILTIHPHDASIEREAYHDRRVIQVGRRGRPASAMTMDR